MSFVPAAAVFKGDTVRLADGTLALVDRVFNADPVPGSLMWETDLGEIRLNAATRVELHASSN